MTDVASHVLTHTVQYFTVLSVPAIYRTYTCHNSYDVTLCVTYDSVYSRSALGCVTRIAPPSRQSKGSPGVNICVDGCRLHISSSCTQLSTSTSTRTDRNGCSCPREGRKGGIASAHSARASGPRSRQSDGCRRCLNWLRDASFLCDTSVAALDSQRPATSGRGACARNCRGSNGTSVSTRRRRPTAESSAMSRTPRTTCTSMQGMCNRQGDQNLTSTPAVPASEGRVW